MNLQEFSGLNKSNPQKNAKSFERTEQNSNFPRPRSQVTEKGTVPNFERDHISGNGLDQTVGMASPNQKQTKTTEHLKQNIAENSK